MLTGRKPVSTCVLFAAVEFCPRTVSSSNSAGSTAAMLPACLGSRRSCIAVRRIVRKLVGDVDNEESLQQAIAYLSAIYLQALGCNVCARKTMT